MRKFLLFLVGIFAVASLAGCGSTLPKVQSYKMDIQQGNIVTSKMLLQLRPGMTKSQVRFIMGTPLVVDSFHKDRWDYFYLLRQEGRVIDQRRVILDFEKDLLVKVRGDVIPQNTTEGSGVVLAKPEVAPLAKPPEQKSVFDKFFFWNEDKRASETPDAAVNPKADEKANEVKPEAESAAPAPSVAPAPAALDVNKEASPEAKLEEASPAAVTAPEVKTPEQKTPDAAPAEDTTSKKSFVDKLKFWKNDSAKAPSAVESKVEAVKAVEPVNAAASSAADTAEAGVSVLALPAAAAIAAAPDVVEAAPASADAVTEKSAEPVVEAPVVAAAPQPTVPEEVKKPAPKSELVEKPVTTSTAVRQKLTRADVLRMDKTLKNELLGNDPSSKVLPNKSVPEAKEPSYMDRLLEKIGF